MKEEENSRPPYDLEARTELFAKRVRQLVGRLRRIDANIIDGRQLIRSSGSIAANYIEANEALSKKDFLVRIRICRKESKESRMWARLVDTEGDSEKERERAALVQEARN